MEKMTYTFSRLGTYGALGNQLWQIAGTVGEAEKVAGTVAFPNWDYAPYFSVPDWMFGPVRWPFHDFHPDYMQDLSHFQHVSGMIKQFFQPSLKAVEAMSGAMEDFSDPTVAVHVRRANNLSLPFHHPVPPLEYFEAALDEIPNSNVWVFSDDLEWCRKQDLFKDARFGLGPPSGINISDLTGSNPLTIAEAAVDLHLMAQCQYHIISNSTFSWWGAFLANSAKVIYPSRWFGDALKQIDTSVMFPKDWVEMEIEDSWTTR